MMWQKDCGKIMLTNLYEDCKVSYMDYHIRPDKCTVPIPFFKILYFLLKTVYSKACLKQPLKKDRK